MEKQKIYISIPISGKNDKIQRQTAALTMAMLSRQGYKPVNPFDIYAGKNPDYWDHICYDLRALADCDAIYMCSGWERSLGCSIEHDFVQQCIAHKKKIYKIIYEY